MEVRVLIRRQYTEDHKPFVEPILKQLYGLVFDYGGYISGETLINCDNPNEHLIVSRWSSINEWIAFHKDPRVKKLCADIDLIIGQPTSHRVYRLEYQSV